MIILLPEGKSYLYQWDLNQTVRTTIPCHQMQFVVGCGQNYILATRARFDGAYYVAEVPNIFLQNPGKIMVYLYREGDDAHTRIDGEIKVKPRAKPQDYIYTETEVISWADILKEIGDFSNLQTEAKDNLVDAINEVLNSQSEALTDEQALDLLIETGFMQPLCLDENLLCLGNSILCSGDHDDKLNYKITKLDNYFYFAEFNKIFYRAGKRYYAKYKPLLGACSVVKKGNLIGRNYDWKYNQQVSLFTVTPAINGRHKVWGVCTAPTSITQGIIDGHIKSSFYDVIPFMLLDGVNDAGLFCEINVVPSGDKGITTGTHPEYEDLFAAMIPRYVLDYASDVDEAIELLEHRNIFGAHNGDAHEEFHFMLADATKTVEVEFVNNQLVVVDHFVDDKPIATNFYLDGYDGTRQSLTTYAQGIERYAILQNGYDEIQNGSDMSDLMDEVQYTKTYDMLMDPLWKSEFSGNWKGWGNLTKDTPTEDYIPIMEHYAQIFENRARDGKTWQTVHKAVYDLESHQVTVSVQETGKNYIFNTEG